MTFTDELPLMLGGHSFVQHLGNDPIAERTWLLKCAGMIQSRKG